LNAPFAPLRRRARNDAPQSLQLSSASKEVSRTFRPRAEAITLLSEIMARLHGLDMPVIQFIQISPEPDAAEVAVSFAQASATCLGRTLLARLGVSELQYQPSAAVKGSVATVTRRRTRKVDPDTLDIVPDSAVAGLCHARLGSDYGDASHATRALPESWLDNVALDFRLVVIGSDAPERCPAALDLATRCHGSILVTTAGKTSLPQSRGVIRQVQLAGGVILGSVLHNAPPPPRLRWPKLLPRFVSQFKV
jgi:hypothetical protein